MMQYIGSAQQLALTGLEVGQFVDLVITGASSNLVLEFKHLDDDDIWHVHPTLDGTWSTNQTLDSGPAGEVLVVRFKIISPLMRVNFTDAPGNYRLSLIYDAVPNF